MWHRWNSAGAPVERHPPNWVPAGPAPWLLTAWGRCVTPSAASQGERGLPGPEVKHRHRLPLLVLLTTTKDQHRQSSLRLCHWPELACIDARPLAAVQQSPIEIEARQLGERQQQHRTPASILRSLAIYPLASLSFTRSVRATMVFGLCKCSLIV